jgi:hypothetical protein
MNKFSTPNKVISIRQSTVQSNTNIPSKNQFNESSVQKPVYKMV